ncbi:MAG: type B 50S ribosomal protein L31 [Planctomycetes bacterium]|nr:type B 50S ribosomal protein L31 [Planctomycetota bacterium]
MKPEIHPAIREVVFQDTVSGAQYRVLSTVKTEQSVKLEGKDYPLVKVDVSSASHPFFTGTQRIMDTAGRVEKFGNKYGKAVGGVTELMKKKPAAAAVAAPTAPTEPPTK